MRVLFESYGCTLNKGEAEEVKEALIADGQTLVGPGEDFDRAVIFTCCVIETTQLKMLRRIKELAAAGAVADSGAAITDKQIAVCGCLGAISESQILKIAPDAMIFAPHRQAAAISEMCTGPGSSPVQFVHPPTPRTPPQSTHPPTIASPKIKEPDNDAVGILPIATGCLGHCTYCITRRARGPLRSRRVLDIIERASKLAEAGCAELQLTAQDTGIFGTDTGTSLPQLLNELATLDGDFMVRVGMMTPNTALQNLDELISAFKSPKIFKFLHLPVQSGDDDILRVMGRQYTVAEFRTVVKAFRDAEPDISLSTDIIVGFPGETDAQFRRSLDLIAEIKPDIVNVTRFSPRPGTEAEMLADQVPGGVSKERSRALTDLRFEITAGNYGKFVGREVDVLATEKRKEGTTFFRTNEYKPVVVRGGHQLGKWQRVKITGHEKTHLAGESIK